MSLVKAGNSVLVPEVELVIDSQALGTPGGEKKAAPVVPELHLGRERVVCQPHCCKLLLKANWEPRSTKSLKWFLAEPLRGTEQSSQGGRRL